MTIRAIFFDLDGVLVDAVSLHYEAFSRAVEDVAGVKITMTEHFFQMDGLPTRSKLDQLVSAGRISLAQVPRIAARKQELTLELANQTVKPDPEKIELCRVLCQSHRLVVVSNCVRASVELLLSLSKLSEYIELYISNEDVEYPKPHPAPYELALVKTSLRPTEALAVEDHERGMASAISAGLSVVQMRYSEVVLRRLQREIAHKERQLTNA